MSTNYLSPEELFKHTGDSTSFHVPGMLAKGGHIEIPQPFTTAKTDAEGNVVINHSTHSPVYETIWQPHTGIEVIDKTVKPFDLVITKFMVIEVLVAICCVLLFGWLGRQIAAGGAAKGKLANLLEAILVFMRDEVVYNAIGRKDGDRFLPLIWTIFFFVLGCNLFGMIPWMGSPTGSLAVTGVMALITFGAVVATGVKEHGLAGFAKAQVPHMDLPGPMALVLVPGIWLIEVFGLLVKHFVLSVRLLANMVAGHLILAVLLGFIGATFGSWAAFGVVPASVAGSIAISCLELFVAFLQAYIFAFLSAVFIGSAIHPH